MFNNCYCRKLLIFLWKIICILHYVHRLTKSVWGGGCVSIKALKTQTFRLKMYTLMRETAVWDGKAQFLIQQYFFLTSIPV